METLGPEPQTLQASLHTDHELLQWVSPGRPLGRAGRQGRERATEVHPQMHPKSCGAEVAKNPESPPTGSQLSTVISKILDKRLVHLWVSGSIKGHKETWASERVSHP